MLRLISTLLLPLLALAFVPGPKTEDFPPLPPVTETNGRLGTCYSFYDDRRMEQAYEAGSRWDRFDFRWNAIAANGYGGHDAILDRYAALEIPMQIVGILGSPPEAFANCPTTLNREPAPPPPGYPELAYDTDDTLWWRACPPRNLHLPWDDPQNYWGQHVHEIVSYYAGRVDIWEIWNEPDWDHFWLGTPETYARLLEVAYRAAKDANPNATILFGGLAYWVNPEFYIQVLDAIAADPDAAHHNAYFDAMSLHLYADVRFAHDISRSVLQEMTMRVGPHPLWLTETGISIWNEDPPPTEGQWPPYYTATGEEAASYIIEAYASARAAGVENFFVFRLHDNFANALGQRFGLTRDDYSVRPAYVAFQVAARHLRDENQITGPFGTTVKRITFWGTPEGRIDVIWNHTDAPLTHNHPAILPTATLIDRVGQTHTVTATNGTFSLSLAPATCDNHPEGRYLIGGPPLLLIQRDTVPPTSTLISLPTQINSTTLTLTWSITDDLAGPWYTELQRAPTPTGPWSSVAGWPETENVTATQIALPGNGTWYFRGRARDRVGHWEIWPSSAEVSTTVELTRTVTLSLTLFTDLDGDGRPGAQEPPITQTQILWMSPLGERWTETLSEPLTLTRTVSLGTHHLTFITPHHLPGEYALQIEGGSGTQVVSHTQGLRPIIGRTYLPVVRRP